MFERFRQASLANQLPLLGAICCLVVGLTLVLLANSSSQYLQAEQQAAHGEALAQQIARRISTALETGDLLSVAASLQRFVETSSAREVAIYDVEGTALGRAGEAQGLSVARYSSPVRIETDIAGEVVIALDTSAATAKRTRFLLSLTLLAILASLIVFLVLRLAVQRTAGRLRALSEKLNLQQHPIDQDNEVAALESAVAALPLELMQARVASPAGDHHYQPHAVLYVHLASLGRYVDSLSESNLKRYTDRLQRIVYAAAACYGGDLQVARQFGLIVCFAPREGLASPALRAACCAWLIRAVAVELEKHLQRSVSISMAIAGSELGPGDASDIYPGLYLQSTLDELQQLCQDNEAGVLLAADIAASADIASGAELEAAGDGFQRLVALDSRHVALLERQRDLILQRLTRNTRQAVADTQD